MTRVAYLDCASGISGDMVLGALVDSGVRLEALSAAIGSLGLPGLRLEAAEVRKQGFRATQVNVIHQEEHTHRHLHHIARLIEGSTLSERQKDLARRIFTRLAEAEAKVHGTSVDKVHFHEVGAADSIADICGAAVGFDLLGVERVVASAIPVGSGRIRIAHGEVGVPAPATAELLKGIPLAASSVVGELTTPTGAAIVAELVASFGPIPAMTVRQIGCGAGQKDFETQANVLRLFVGELALTPTSDDVCVLETNLDDISGEVVGYCAARLLEAGALDVYTTPIQMKKGRPGVKLTVLGLPADAERFEEILFRETTTLGVRRWTAARRVLPRQTHTVETAYGPIEGKIAWLADGAPRFSPEYEACRRAAAEWNVPLFAVCEAAGRAFDPRTAARRA